MKISYNGLNIIIEEKPINLTNKQAQACLRVCQMLSNGYKDIHLFRFLFRVPEGVAVKRYPPVCNEEGVPIAENIRLMEEAIQERVAREKMTTAFL
jgi:hypothetical protein